MFITALHTRHNHAIIRDGLVRWYPMNEGAGSTLREMSGSADNATLAGGYGWETPGVDFNGSSGYASFSRTDMPRGSLTVTARIRPDGWGDGNYGRIVHAADQSTNGFWFYVNNSGGGGTPPGTATLTFSYERGGGSFGYSANNSILSLGTVVSVAVTRSTTNAEMKFYLNGALDVTRTDASTSEIDLSATSVPRIGARVDNTRWFNGMISDVRIYNRALSADEIAAIASGKG